MLWLVVLLDNLLHPARDRACQERKIVIVALIRSRGLHQGCMAVMVDAPNCLNTWRYKSQLRLSVVVEHLHSLLILLEEGI